MTGPEELTFAEAVHIIAQASGRPVVYRGEPEGTLVRRLPYAGIACR